MNVKETLELEIESNGMDGEGVAHVDGKVVFVPYTLKGERVRAVVKSVKPRYATASVIKVLKSSPYRVAPDCPYYFKCGGCDMRHITPEYRREILLAEFKNNLKKIAELSVDGVDFFAATGETAGRNKVAMPFGYAQGKIALGLYRQNTHDFLAVDCLMLGDIGHRAALAAVEFAERKRLPPYDPKTGRGLLRHLVIREIGGRASVTLVINGNTMGSGVDAEFAAALPDECDVFICENTARNNVILGEKVRLLHGSPRLKVDVMGVKAELSPLSFFQINDGVRDMLYSRAIDAVGARTLIDLYSGIGITSNLAAKKCDKVFAVEVVPEATADADRTAAENGNVDKIKNICGDVEKVLPRIKHDITGDVDVLVDPPRKGCGAAVMNEIADIAPERLIYISCDHATMCRDIRLFIDRAADAGAHYDVDFCALFDMFKYTHHVEALMCLKRKSV